MTVASKAALGRTMLATGWLCAVAIALLILDLALLLPHLPEHWWHPEQPPRIESSGMVVDLRMMAVDSLLGWVGGWGILGTLVWLPVAVIKLLRARHVGYITTRIERTIVILVCVLLCATWALTTQTPLRYTSYGFPVQCTGR